MILRRTFLMALLALWMPLLPGAAAAERIQRSTDEQGTIHIRNTVEAGQEKDKDGEVKDPSSPVAPEQPPPGLNHP